MSIVITAICSCAFAQYTALDPSRQIPNARVLSLGKAYVGLAEGTGAIYSNPAGMADSSSWQLSSMSGKLLDEYNYLSFSGIYPTSNGVIGFGFVGTSIAGAYVTTVDPASDPLDPIYIIDTTQPEMGNRNNVFILSYANKMRNISYLSDLPYADSLSLGANLKLFSASLYGGGISGGDASGMDLDLGVKYQPEQKWMSFGATLQNTLPASMGGKLTYVSGHEESYPAVIKLGSAFKLVGKESALKSFKENEVQLLVDIDSHPTLRNYPIVWHAGLEWKPLSLIALRYGIDQDAVGDGNGGMQVVTDNTYGVGLSMGGFDFDYAYHTYAGMPNLSNYYFTLSYGVDIPSTQIKKRVEIDTPSDRLITFEEEIPIKGRVIDPTMKRLFVNGRMISFDHKGRFSTLYPIEPGKNSLTIGGETVRVLRLVKFPDVEPNYWVDKPISMLAMSNVINGYPDGTFKPEGGITRAEMCTLLVKLMPQEEVRTAPAKFKDVNRDHWASKYIDRAAKLGLVTGYPNGTFRPQGKITRAEGLAMIARFAQIVESDYNQEFSDVNNGYWASRIIAGAYKAGILRYLGDDPFEPNRKLTRAETVEMLYRTEPVTDLLSKDLLNWDGYLASF